MKTTINIITCLSLALFIIGGISSCSKTELANNGVPRIRYVRITNPTSADSLLIGANQGSLIAIVGDNLDGTKEIWFNDQRASLNPTFITSTSILVSVPSPIPSVITNKLKLIFNSGDSLMYDFIVQISKPSLTSMGSEFVNAGEVATIRGDFFYAPISVKFNGGISGELVSITDKILQVRVPAGATAGPVTVTSNFGETKSDFWFRDNRNIFVSSDPYEGWWNSSYVVTNPGAADPQKINGNYIRVKKILGAWSWNEIAGGDAASMPNHSKNIPDAAILKPADYNLKFEVNTIKPYTASIIVINAGLTSENNAAFKWMPPYDTKGQWQTVVIPFEDVVTAYGKPLSVSANGYWTRILMQGPGDLDADICFDNFRIVPKISK